MCLAKVYSAQEEHKAKSKNGTEIFCLGPKVLLLLARLFCRFKTKLWHNIWGS